MVIHQKKFEAKLSRYQPLENTAIRIEVSPARNESEGWMHDDWEVYVQMLGRKGYVVDLKRYSKNIVRGYTVGKGNSVYKSSQLGSERSLIPSKIEQTWQNLHPGKQTATVAGNPEVQPRSQSADQAATDVSAQPCIKPAPIVHYDIEVADRHYRVDIPKETYHILANAISLADTEKFAVGILDMQKTAMLLFAGYIDAATAMSESHGGGGSAPSSDWGRDKDEDECEWARRCARMAMEMSRPRRRGMRR